MLGVLLFFVVVSSALAVTRAGAQAEIRGGADDCCVARLLRKDMRN